MAKICVHAFVSGTVQGVWYRQSTKEEALKSGVTGWAKNLNDGRVEVLLCGDADAVANVQAWLHQGPPLAQVDGVIDEVTGYQHIKGFATS